MLNAGFLFILVATPDDCSPNCYRAIATTVLSCFASVDTMASIWHVCTYLQYL